MSKRALELSAADGEKLAQMFQHIFKTALEIDMSKEALCGSLRGALDFLEKYNGSLEKLVKAFREAPLTESEMTAIKIAAVAEMTHDDTTH